MDSGTCGSQVSQLPSNQSATNRPCCHWFTATPCPSYSMFKPFIFTANANIGSLTVSPSYGENDPAKIQPRFKIRVDRRHDLYKGHEKLIQFLESDNEKAMKMVQNLKELETKCVDDMEEILGSFNDALSAKVSQFFDHMCSMELNFYK